MSDSDKRSQAMLRLEQRLAVVEMRVRHLAQDEFGPQSERGTRFFERMPAVIESLRAQGRDVFAFLMHSLQQSLAGGALPQLAPID